MIIPERLLVDHSATSCAAISCIYPLMLVGQCFALAASCTPRKQRPAEEGHNHIDEEEQKEGDEHTEPHILPPESSPDFSGIPPECKGLLLQSVCPVH
mmetsp:Transcript_4165/g.10040  ORF Transcript_4165/g.10040 Transcript_4165/m.10040 type:complete len:98 (+) Transcript_4165:375-668(+)